MSENITQILNDDGNQHIVPEIYDELLKLARSVLTKNQRHDTLDTCAVVHESVIKFYQKKSHSFASRGHFYALMAKIMRGLVIDYIRHKKAKIRGGDFEKVSITGVSIADDQQRVSAHYLLDVDKAMQQLAAFDENLAQLLTMKFYVGLTIADLATCYGVSESTIKRELRTARAFVKSQMSDYHEK